MVGILGADIVSDKPDVTLTTRGTDWRRLVEAGIIDTLVVMSVKWDTEIPFESTREIYRSILQFCDGRCEVLFPIAMYNFSHKGVPGYQQATKLPAEKIAGELMKIAWEEGADGVVLECVDYNNYSAKVRSVMRDRLESECRFKRKDSQPVQSCR